MTTTSIPLARRAGGPDLARGLALLGIGLANIVGWIHGPKWTVLLKQADTTVIDRVADVVVALVADNRGFPLFALLFGYGIGILHRRSVAAGERPARFVIRMLKRHVVLAAIGLAHAILLFSGDILVDYAIIGMLCVLLMTRRPLALAVAAFAALPALGTWGWADAVIGLSGGDGYAAAGVADYGTGLMLRLDDAASSLAVSLVADIGLLSPMALGAIAARFHLLEQVEANRDLLRPLARWGLLIGLVGAIPLTAVMVADPHLRIVGSETVLGILGVVHQLTGLAGAVGIAAASALIAARVRAGSAGRTVGARWVEALEALGAVALTAYILQSVVFLALFPPYTADLGSALGTAGAAVIVLAAWLLMLPAATALRRRGRRGPLEALLRRLAGSTTPAGAGRLVGDRR